MEFHSYFKPEVLLEKEFSEIFCDVQSAKQKLWEAHPDLKGV